MNAPTPDDYVLLLEDAVLEETSCRACHGSGVITTMQHDWISERLVTCRECIGTGISTFATREGRTARMQVIDRRRASGAVKK